jgi:hypothetical protein
MMNKVGTPIANIKPVFSNLRCIKYATIKNALSNVNTIYIGLTTLLIAGYFGDR